MKYYPIDEGMARAAHDANSMRDYGENTTTLEYQRRVDEAYAAGEERKQKYPDEAERIDYLCEKYARRLAEWYNENSRVEAMCPSILISGAGNFPVRKKEQQNSRRKAMMKKRDDVDAILRKIETCGTDAIKSNDARALEKLRLKLEMLDDDYATMKEANAYYKEYGTIDGCPGIDDHYREWLTREDVVNCGEHGTPLKLNGCPYPAYYTTNNRATAKRVRERIEKIEAIKNAGTQEHAEEEIGIPGVRVVENAEAMRIQMIFDGKPDEYTRAVLKKYAFRWSPRFSAWQRDLNENGISAVKYVIRELKKREEPDNG